MKPPRVWGLLSRVAALCLAPGVTFVPGVRAQLGLVRLIQEGVLKVSGVDWQMH